MMNAQCCRLNYDEIIEHKRAEMVEHRKRGNTADVYLYMIRLKLLQDLYGLQEAWDDLSDLFAVEKSETDTDAAYKTIYAQIFMMHQASFMMTPDGLTDLMDQEPTVGSVSFTRLRKLAELGVGGDNGAIEELEFCVTARSVIVPMTLYWAALGMTGVPKPEAYSQVVEYIPRDEQSGTFRSEWLDSFLEFFACAETSANMTVGGFGGEHGKYKALPPLW